MNSNQTINKVRKQYAEARRKLAVARNGEKSEWEMARAINNLIDHEISTEGIDPESLLGEWCRRELREQKLADLAEELEPKKREIDRSPLSDDFTKGRF